MSSLLLPSFKNGVKGAEQGDRDEHKDHGTPDPAQAIIAHGKKEPALRQSSEHQPEDQGRSRPFELFQYPAQSAEDQDQNQIREGILLGEGAEVDEHQDEGDEQAAAYVRHLDDLFQEEKDHAHGDEVRDDHDPDEGVSEAEVSSLRFRPEHVRAGDDAVHDEGPDENRHEDAGRNPERDGRDQAATERRVVGRPRTQHPFDGPFAEALLVGRALDGVGVRKPLGRRASHAGYDRAERADSRAAENEPDVTEYVADALLDPAQRSGPSAGDARTRHRKIDDLRDREKTDGDRHQPDAVPQERLAEGEALNAGDRVEAHRRNKKAQSSRDRDP